MTGSGLSAGAVKPFLGIARKVIPWALDHPFVARPATWNLVLVAWFVITAVVVAAGIVLTPLFLALGVAFAFIMAGLWGWHRLTAASERPIVFVTQFAPATPGAGEAALNHLNAVEDRLANGPLGDRVELRSLPAAVSLEQARRLIDIVHARAVVFGKVRAIADVGTWEAELLARWSGDDSNVTSITGDHVVVQRPTRQRQAPDRHEVHLEAQAPLARLVAERYESEHVDRIEGTLLILIADELRRLGGEDEQVGACLDAAEKYRASLSTQTRAALEMIRATVEGSADVKALLQRLESAAQQDANHVDLWNMMVAFASMGHVAGDVPTKDFVKYAKGAVDADPSSALAHYNLGEAYVTAGRPGKAAHQFELAAVDPGYSERYDFQLGRGMVNYNIGQFERARDAYRAAVDLEPSARAHLYLGDAHRRLGENDDARRHYLVALHLQPTLVDAHHGYWFLLQPGEEPISPSPWFDRIGSWLRRFPGRGQRRWRRPLLSWWLKRHYHRHPEDTRIHFMLGAHALLRRDFETAEERLQFAYDVFGGADTDALARLAVVRGLQGRHKEARADLERLRDTPSPQTGGRPSDEELRDRLRHVVAPFAAEPRLLGEHHSLRFQTIAGEVFVRVT